MNRSVLTLKMIFCDDIKNSTAFMKIELVYSILAEGQFLRIWLN